MKRLQHLIKFNSVFVIAVTTILFACDDKKMEDPAPVTESQTVDTSDVKQPLEQNQGQTEKTVEDVVVVPTNCTGLSHGQGLVRTRYESATSTLGLNNCNGESQTVSCNNGVLTSTGTFLFDECLAVHASLAAGDILIAREDGSGVVATEGEVMAFSANGTYKGFAFDTAGRVPWYTYGLRLSYDGMVESKFAVEIGSSNAALAIEVKKFDFITSYPFTMDAYTTGGASDGIYFQGAASEEYNGTRFVATDDGKYLDVYFLGIHIPECRIAMPVGRHARAIFSGTQSFVYSPHVAYTLGTAVSVTGYGVSKINGSCTSSGGTPATLVDLFQDAAMADAKVTGLLHVRTEAAPGAESWKNDIFVTAGAFLSSQVVRHWHYDTVSLTWVALASAFEDIPRQIFQDGTGDLYTIEVEDLFDDIVHLRRYGHTEVIGTHFKGTLYSDPEQVLLNDTGLGQWIVVLPTL